MELRPGVELAMWQFNSLSKEQSRREPRETRVHPNPDSVASNNATDNASA
jgi:hypothetical protein